MKQAIVALNRIRLSFRLNMQISGHKILVRKPVIGRYLFNPGIPDGIPQFAPGCRAAVAQYAVDEYFPMSINSNPNPAVPFFEEI